MSPQEIDDHNYTFRDCSFVARREAQKELAHFRLYPDHGGRDPVGAATAAQAAHEAEMETLGRLYARAMHRIGELEAQIRELGAEVRP
jgi:hypothetical protein